MTIAEKPFYKTRSQVLMMLYYALHETGGGTRQDIVDFIAEEGWFLHAAEDNRPYPFAGTTEPCWRILVAYGRKDASDFGHLFDRHNDWKLNREGEEEFKRVLGYFREGRGDVARGFIWTPKFKRLLDKRYEPTSADEPRPRTIYTGFERVIRRMLLDLL